MTRNENTQHNSHAIAAPQQPTKTSVEKIRPDLNLEKWSIWQPSKSKTKPRARIFRREIVLPDGRKVSAEVEVGFTQKGMLTTEDQKTFYALIKIWEEKGKPTEQTFYSSRGLARILKKGWGTNVIESTDQSLLRLRMTPLIWRNSYHDSARKNVIEQLDPFNILSDLKIIRRKSDGHITKEYGFFKFNDFILTNLLQHYTKPLLLDVVLSFKSELAQILYTHLDLIMARRDHYERKTKELFDDLGLDGESYKHPSKRRQALLNALKELKGVRLTTGVITTATLERTKDDTDFKLIIRKSARMALPVAETISETQPTQSTNELSIQAKELVAYFFKRFHNVNVENCYPTSKAINQAISLITQHGIDQARHVVDFAHRVTQEGKYKPQTFGGIVSYTTRALADYEDAKRREQAAAHAREERRRAHEEEQLTRLYEDFRSQELLRLRATLPSAELVAIEQAAITKFDKKDSNHFGRDRARRLAIEEALATHGHIPSLAEWKQLQAHASHPESVSYEA